MDKADIANDLMVERIEHIMAARQPRHVHIAEYCDDCGVLIPSERRQALIARGCLRCVDCQTMHERRGGGQ